MTIKDAQVKDGELLPCPFCGKSPEIDDVDDQRDGSYVPDDCIPVKAIIIGCSKCGIEQHGDNEGAAMTKWNTRAESLLQSQLAIARGAQTAEQPVGMMPFKPLQDEKAYALAVHLKGFEAHVAGKENAKQFRDEMRMLLDMIKNPPYLSQPHPVLGDPKRCKHDVWPSDHCYDCEKEANVAGQPVDRSELSERAPAKRIDEILTQPYVVLKAGQINYEVRRDFLQLATEVKHLRIDLTEATKREISADEMKVAADFAVILAEAHKRGTLGQLRNVAVYFTADEMAAVLTALGGPTAEIKGN